MTKLLAIYLMDHHAGSVAGAALARRAARHNSGLAGGAALHDVARQIDEDRHTLEHVMRTLDVRPSPIKVALARAAEAAGRLKLNGRFVSRSPLSAVVELEALSLGILGKRKLWQALERTTAVAAAGQVDFAALAERAHDQHRVVEATRREAARTALDEP